MTLMKSVLSLIALLFSCYLLSVQAAVIYVNQFANGNNTGLNWTDAYQDLHLALAAAEAGDELWITSGNYFPSGGNDRYATFLLQRGIALYGGFAGAETSREQRDWATNLTILNGDIGLTGDESDNSYSVVTVYDPDENNILDGFDIRNGVANAEAIEIPTYDAARRGGGVLIRTESERKDYELTIRNCRFSNHIAEYGGAIYGDARYNKNISIRAENCRFENNRALFGAAYSTDAGNTGKDGIQFINCIFTQNRADIYGVIFAQVEGEEDGHLLIEGCRFEANERELIDVYNFFSKVKFQIQISRSFFLNNDATANNLPLISYRPNASSSLEMDSVVFLSNVGQLSILNTDVMGSLTIRRSYFERNQFSSLFEARPEKLVLDSCYFIRNILEHSMLRLGAGSSYLNGIECISNRASTLLSIYDYYPDTNTKIENCLFESNSANGLLSVHGDSLLVSGLQIRDDQEANCNVGFNARYNRIVNSTFTRQSGFSPSIPIVVSPKLLALAFINCTFYNYMAGETGLLFRFLGSEEEKASLRIHNSIIWDTLAPEHPLFSLENAIVDIEIKHALIPNTLCDSSLIQRVFYNSDPVVGTLSCEEAVLPGLNPLFTDAPNGDLSLLACSPGVDVGNDTLFPVDLEFDLTGQQRIVNKRIDLGAFELAADASVFKLTVENIPATTQEAGDGQITLLEISGGTPNYYYTWNTGDTSSRITALSPGDYVLTLTDEQGCTEIFTFTVDFTNPTIDPLSEWGASLFPNPAPAGQSIHLKLQSMGSAIRVIRLIDLRKKVLWEMAGPHRPGMIALPVPEASGLYVLELVDQQGRKGYMKYLVQ